jgi:hypothetical protein
MMFSLSFDWLIVSGQMPEVKGLILVSHVLFHKKLHDGLILASVTCLTLILHGTSRVTLMSSNSIPVANLVFGLHVFTLSYIAGEVKELIFTVRAHDEH